MRLESSPGTVASTTKVDKQDLAFLKCAPKSKFPNDEFEDD
jgi:hypothetical protein